MRNFFIELKWGIIFTVVSILWMVAEKTVGLHDVHISKHEKYSFLFAIVAFAVYFCALLDKKKNFYKGTMNWTQGFISGVIISVIVAAVSPIAQYISFEIISPDFFKNSITYTVSNNIQTPEQAERYFNMNSYIVMGSIGGISAGVLTAAIVALLVRTKPLNKK
jgi:MFS family permease